MGFEHNLDRVCLVLIFAWAGTAQDSISIYNVKDYGAIADGLTDNTQDSYGFKIFESASQGVIFTYNGSDTISCGSESEAIPAQKAFQKAWEVACSAATAAGYGKPKILIPEGEYLVGPLTFKGPCKGFMAVQLEGQLVASTDLSLYSSTKNWIEFQYIDGLSILGGGRIDGRGASAWPQNQCPKKSNCQLLPVSLVLSFVTNTTISRISSVDSKSFHMNIFASKNVHLESITVTAPADSPNTDGIHIGDSVGVSIANSNIGTGDDCVSIGPGSVNVSVSNVSCGPGHGISVGSLGKYPNEKDVVGVTVKNCTLTDTTNGVRVKTWQSTPSPSTASDFVFEDIAMNNVSNPIIIDQEYCPRADCTQTSPSQVKIDRVAYRNINGTSASQEAIKLVCSMAVPCNGVELSNINLVYNGDGEKDLTTTCVNVKGTSNGNVMPNSCI